MSGEYRVAHGNPCGTGYELLPWLLYDDRPPPTVR
jgi:hypothetical protein